MRRAALLLLLAACGGGGGDVGPCVLDAGLAADLGTVTSSEDNSNVHRSMMPDNVFLEVALDENEAPDLLHLELYAGHGAFRGGAVRTGSFSLLGVESRYDSCGTCLLLLVDRAPDTLRPAAYFMPESGTLVLDAVADRLAGHLENVVLRHVTIDINDPDGNGPREPTLATVTASGCKTTLRRLDFDLPY